MNKEELKRCVLEEIDKKCNYIIDIGTKVEDSPELGFKEEKTAKLVAHYFRELGLPFEIGVGVTGVKAHLEGRKAGPRVALLGELDAVTCFEHPKADPMTGAAHACGHNAQLAAMIGAAMGLVGAGAAQFLGGDVVFFAVPAEEYVEISYRERLRKDGLIRYLGGKSELIWRGAFDDVDMALMIHAYSGDKVGLADSYNGCITKLIRYVGRPSHAGSAPDEGVNALYAALVGLTAINAIRETFIDGNYVRVHPIMIKGGDLVNVIPSDVRLETYVRGKSIEAIQDANHKVNQALKGGALSLGARVQIQDIPGYLPLIMDPGLADVVNGNLDMLVGSGNVISFGHRAASTDLGDLSHFMPVIEVGVGGFSGTLHGADFQVTDPKLAYVTSAKILALSVIDLLYGDASTAKEVRAGYKPYFTRQEYVSFMDNLFAFEDFGQLRE
jgi:amidohydrolase